MNQYIIIPTIFLELNVIGYSEIWVGLIISFAPLGSMFSQNFYFKNQQTYKFPLFLSCCSFIIGNFMYFTAFYHKSLIMILVSRFLIGVGGARSIIRKYFREQISNDLISYYSFFYISLVYIGIGLGALIGLIINLLNNNTTLMVDQTINIYNYSGFIPLLIWAAYTLFFLFLYNENVGITIKESHDADIDLVENRIISSNSYKSEQIEIKVTNLNEDVNNNEKIDDNNKLKEDFNKKENLINYKKEIINKEINDLIENHRKNLTSYMNISYFTLVILFLIIRVSYNIHLRLQLKTY